MMARTAAELVPTECGSFVVKKCNPGALLVEAADGRTVWIARHLIDEWGGIDKDSDDGDKGELILPAWLAIEKGLV